MSKLSALNSLRTYLNNEKLSLDSFDTLLKIRYHTNLRDWLEALEANGDLAIVTNLASLVLLDLQLELEKCIIAED